MWVSKIMGLPPVIILVISDSRKVAKLCFDWVLENALNNHKQIGVIRDIQSYTSWILNHNI